MVQGMQQNGACIARTYDGTLHIMFICKQLCAKDRNVKKQRYSLGLHVYCAICEKMFLKVNNPGVFCKCCGCRTRARARTKSSAKVRKYIDYAL